MKRTAKGRGKYCDVFLVTVILGVLESWEVADGSNPVDVQSVLTLLYQFTVTWSNYLLLSCKNFKIYWYWHCTHCSTSYVIKVESVISQRQFPHPGGYAATCPRHRLVEKGHYPLRYRRLSIIIRNHANGGGGVKWPVLWVQQLLNAFICHKTVQGPARQ